MTFLNYSPPPRGVKHGVPSPGNDTRRETSDFYSQVIAVLAPRWRVVRCITCDAGFTPKSPRGGCHYVFEVDPTNDLIGSTCLRVDI